MGRPQLNPLALAVQRAGVPLSPEFKRVAALPLRAPNGDKLVESMTAAFKTPGGQQTLTPDQALALHEMRANKGNVVLMRPGEGKTHIGVLAATVMENVRNPLYLCPSNAKDELINERIPELRKHWRVHPHLIVCGFGELSTKKGKQIFKAIMPNLIIVDEVHMLKNVDSARGNRILEFIREYPETRVIAMTGTPSVRELAECAHLFAFALRERSPLPIDARDVELWSLALGSDVDEYQRPAPGALSAFIELLTPEERARCKSQLELVRRGFRKRLAYTPGVTVSSSTPYNVPITIRSPRVEVPAKVREAFDELHATWCVGDEELTDAFEFSAAARQLTCGFYYRWVWPNGKENKPWLESRKAWHRFVRQVVVGKPSRRNTLSNTWSKSDPRWKEPISLDSKGLVEDACKAHEAYTRAKDMGHPLAEKIEDVPRIDCPEYRAWVAVRHEYDPVTEAVWLDDYLIDYAVEWAHANQGAIWVPYSTMAAKIESKGIDYFGGGPKGAERLRIRSSATTGRGGPIALSFKSHHVAKDLQHWWSRALYLLPPSRGDQWEQSMARFHRRGQQAPSVEFDVLLLCRQTFNAWQQALRDADYANDTFDEQRLCQADLTGVLSENEIQEVKDGRGDPLWKS